MYKLVIILLLVSICVLIFCIYKNKERFISNKMILDKINFNDMKSIKLEPIYMIQKDERDEYNKCLEDDSHILKERRPNKVLRDVNELMNYEIDDKEHKDIYDYTSVGNKKYTKDMWFW